jgi:hypothetical protein
MMRAAKIADQKSSTVRRSLHLAVREIMAAFTMIRNRPSVSKTAGRVKTLTNEPMVTLIAPKRSAIQK